MKKVPAYLAATLLAFAQAETVSLSPALHANGVVGTSSAKHPEDFAPGGHDPKRDEAVLLQSLEPSVSLRAGKHLEGFATATIFTDDQDNFDWEWEEYFFKLMDGEGKADLRGGRMLSRVGFHNPTHLHGWETVDMPLPHALMLGDPKMQATARLSGALQVLTRIVACLLAALEQQQALGSSATPATAPPSSTACAPGCPACRSAC
jgi:hypothetical protein